MFTNMADIRRNIEQANLQSDTLSPKEQVIYSLLCTLFRELHVPPATGIKVMSALVADVNTALGVTKQ